VRKRFSQACQRMREDLSIDTQSMGHPRPLAAHPHRSNRVQPLDGPAKYTLRYEALAIALPGPVAYWTGECGRCTCWVVLLLAGRTLARSRVYWLRALWPSPERIAMQTQSKRIPSVGDLTACAARHLADYIDPRSMFGFNTYDYIGSPGTLEPLDCFAPNLLSLRLGYEAIVPLFQPAGPAAELLAAMRRVLAPIFSSVIFRTNLGLGLSLTRPLRPVAQRVGLKQWRSARFCTVNVPN
jgi:hypothetical protein